MTLDEHLGRYYRAIALTREPTAPLVDALKAAMRDDSALAREAGARLVALAGIHEQRCVISKLHRDLLSAALSAS